MKIDFSKRLFQLELLDNEHHAYEDIKTNFNELIFINKHTGGSALTFHGLKIIFGNKLPQNLTIVDVGLGAGDFLNYLVEFKIKNNLNWKIIGIDILEESKKFAIEKYPILNENVQFEIKDYKEWFKENKIEIDIITASLFCHHLTDKEFVEFVELTENYSKLGYVINDLHRHPIAYYFIKIMCQIFSKSNYTKNDAPISVLKGFTKKELLGFFNKNTIINWKWAFRYLIISKK